MQMIKNVVKVFLNMSMEQFIRVISWRIKGVDMDRLFGLIKLYIKDIGEMV